MKKFCFDGIDVIGVFLRLKFNLVIEFVVIFLEERNLYGDKYICIFVIFMKLYVCYIYLF